MMNDLFFKEVLKHSFNYPVKVKFADGKTEQYGGDGTSPLTARSQFLTSSRTLRSA